MLMILILVGSAYGAPNEMDNSSIVTSNITDGSLEIERNYIPVPETSQGKYYLQDKI